MDSGTPVPPRDSVLPDARGSVCANCPTPQRADVNGHALPLGECPVCGSFWIVRWGGTSYGYARISADDYRAWLAANGYGVQRNGQTVLPAWNRMPNVRVLANG